jgi:hypothetical protein
MTKSIKNGSKRTIKGKPCVYYDGYWIRRYEQDQDTLADKKRTIDQLTRRVFHHVEAGINAPGYLLDKIEAIYEQETDPARKRVKGAMLAGASLNRGRDILTRIVELEESGVKIETDNELFHMCGQCFTKALKLGKNIKLASGEEGLDELWGEPFKVFSLPMEDFFRSRYIKVAQTMSQIDQITDVIKNITKSMPILKPVKPILIELCESAKLACETLRSDSEIFEVWPRYVAAREKFEAFSPDIPEDLNEEDYFKYQCATVLIQEGGNLLTGLSTVRVPMPKSVKNFIDKSDMLLLL